MRGFTFLGGVVALGAATTALALPLAEPYRPMIDGPGLNLSSLTAAETPPSVSELLEAIELYQDGSDQVELPRRRSTDETVRDEGLSETHQPGGDEYVVIFDDEDEERPEIMDILSQVGLKPSDPDVNHVFANSRFRGFSGKMKSHCIDGLNAMKAVKYVEPVMKVSVQGSREGSPWGLERISQQSRVQGDLDALDFTYNFEDDGQLGKGVDIYVVDSGLNTDHKAFGGRARMGFSRDGPEDLGPQSDQDGHGTHAAGIAAASMVGVASSANVIGVKVLGSDGSGSSSDAVKGLDWVIKEHERRKNEPGFVGSVASLSWSLPSRSAVVDRIINAAVDAGIHVSVAAGNQEKKNACTQSPASTGGEGPNGKGGKAVTVGSVNGQDAMSEFSNTGPCVDIYAPGERIISTWIGDDSRVESLDGTSMACPFVTGVMAYLMARDPALAASPSLMKETLKSSSLKQVQLSNREGTEAGVGLLLNNGVQLRRESRSSGNSTEP